PGRSAGRSSSIRPPAGRWRRAGTRWRATATAGSTTATSPWSKSSTTSPGRFGKHSLEAVIRHGGFLYSSDSYNDDLPYWVRVEGQPHLVIPYTLEVN